MKCVYSAFVFLIGVNAEPSAILLEIPFPLPSASLTYQKCLLNSFSSKLSLKTQNKQNTTLFTQFIVMKDIKRWKIFFKSTNICRLEAVKRTETWSQSSRFCHLVEDKRRVHKQEECMTKTCKT